METKLQLALLIDGENAEAALLPQMLVAVSKYGILTIRRVYGDWSKPNMTSWKDILNKHGLKAEHQFNYTKGKNATDIALVIDAMDLLHKAEVDGFCIVSSDSDFTPLVARIRQSNLFVMGIGRKTTPKPFIEACNGFLYSEDLAVKKVNNLNQVSATKAKPIAKGMKDLNVPAKLESLFRKAFALAVQDDGWAHLGAIGNSLKELEAAFDPRTYGHKQLLQLVQAYPEFIKVRKTQTNEGSEIIRIRLK